MRHRLAFAFLSLVLVLSAGAQDAELAAASLDSQPDALEAAPESIYLLEQVGGRVACRLASFAERFGLSDRRGPRVPLHVIYPAGGVRANAGFSITLRATAQLEGFPAAKAAFIRAAQVWEARIANPVSVTIDVDFGLTRFGTPYPSPNVLGSTGAAEFFVNYPTARAAMQARADTPAEVALYAALPAGATVPTDLGGATRVLGASNQLLMLGFTLPADRTFPSVGFNSAHEFDFDPSNGIDPSESDFEAVAVHEIGHALGFGSFVGAKELDPTAEISPTIFDLFRFRPGVTSGVFQSAQRPMSSGGAHIHFAGSGATAMSTGRPDGTGGDGQQASHWRDDTGGNPFIGLMDPTIPSGTHITLSQTDLDAFAVMGYALVSVASVPAAPSNLTATATSSSVIRLNWTDNSNDETEFRIEQKVASSFVDLGSASANSTQINVTGFDAGQTATFRVRARNASGNSGYSNEATATTTGAPGSPCTPNSTTACMLNNRFRVTVRFRGGFDDNPADSNANVKSVTGFSNPNFETAFFFFNSDSNIEMMVKILDQGNTNGAGQPTIAVLFGSATPLRVELTIFDTLKGVTKTYSSAFNTQAGRTDFTAFVK